MSRVDVASIRQPLVSQSTKVCAHERARAIWLQKTVLDHGVHGSRVVDTDVAWCVATGRVGVTRNDAAPADRIADATPLSFSEFLDWQRSEVSAAPVNSVLLKSGAISLDFLRVKFQVDRDRLVGGLGLLNLVASVGSFRLPQEEPPDQTSTNRSPEKNFHFRFSPGDPNGTDYQGGAA